jgi:uncharacterized phage protein (TIGR01671 family)
MREIKFRIINPDGNTDYMTIEELLFETYSKYWFDDLHISQYTGLKDKNGVEIYEGDILRHEFYWSDIKGFEINKKIGTVDFRGGSFSIKETGLPLSFADDYEKSKVIGNIYENPELLENKKE